MEEQCRVTVRSCILYLPRAESTARPPYVYCYHTLPQFLLQIFGQDTAVNIRVSSGTGGYYYLDRLLGIRRFSCFFPTCCE